MIETQNIICWRYVTLIFQCINNLMLLKFIAMHFIKKLNKIYHEPDWPFVSFWNLKSLSFTCPYLLYHSLLFAVTCCITRFFVTRCTARCHSLYHSLSFVVTRCSAHLSFYNRSFLLITFSSSFKFFHMLFLNNAKLTNYNFFSFLLEMQTFLGRGDFFSC